MSTRKEPAFIDSFLRNAWESLARRRRSLSRRGRLSITTGKDDFEWFAVAHESANRLTVVLQLVEGNRAHLFIRSNRATDRGKILARIEDIAVIDNGFILVRALEDTISVLESHTGEAFDELDRIWNKVQWQCQG